MSWFQRKDKNIQTPTENKIDTPEGLWKQCPNCKAALTAKNLEKNAYVCTNCEHHLSVGSEVYFQLLFDEEQFEEIAPNLVSADPLQFKDTKNYPDRIAATIQKTGLKDALRAASGKMNNIPLTVACMDFQFIGGSMGSVVGEKIKLAIQHAIAHKTAMLIVSKSGGARMMEGALSLMQMAKISAQLALLAEQGLPYISLMTDPTTGGVTASYAMLGDLNIAEPKALIGFAGPRVIKETIGRDLPEGFQQSEFLLEHGFLDFIVNRKDLKTELTKVLTALMPAGE